MKTFDNFIDDVVKRKDDDDDIELDEDWEEMGNHDTNEKGVKQHGKLKR